MTATQTLDNKPKSIGLNDIYLHYSNKKYSDSCTYTRPHIPVAERTDNELSLTKSEWKEIIDVYLEHCYDYLMTGAILDMWFRLGGMQFVRYYPKNRNRPTFINWKKYRETGEREYFTNDHTNGQSLVLNWYKPHSNVMKFWGVRIVKQKQKSLSKLLYDQPETIYKFNER